MSKLSWALVNPLGGCHKGVTEARPSPPRQVS
jgi:hypothetical protein